LARGPLNK